ncbi:hypothetical protein [Nocardioides sp.]|uniref:hypothetical protein n=1 Tax=Nocardioides sp. TaxID=35761 RepID=UPI00271B8B71|nr:hypothetical protein [Nocardioides sp.]MDO9455371.1 hypothetical protein [Nocardioides sp.]
MSKLTLAVAFAAGYVVGAKAGRDRYEQIRAGAQKVAENPRVQAATDAAKEKAGEVASSVAETAKEKATEVAGAAKDKAADAVGSAKEKAAETGPTIQAAP